MYTDTLILAISSSFQVKHFYYRYSHKNFVLINSTIPTIRIVHFCQKHLSIFLIKITFKTSADYIKDDS